MSFVKVFVVAIFIYADLLVNGDEIKCSRLEACYPFDNKNGQSCTKGDRINLRFGIDMAPENKYTSRGVENTQGTYASCPIVDELQAFSLNNAGMYSSLALPPKLPTKVNETISLPFTKSPDAWLRAYGFGGSDNIIIPNASTSTGAVLIMTKDGGCPKGQVAFVRFLILSVTMKLGRFVYTDQQNQPLGVGFTPTCDSNTCLLDGSLRCIGPSDRKNCAVCMTPSEVFYTNIQVWASYDGTDGGGRQFTSGASNPLNFRAFAGSGVYNTVASSLGKIGK
eukprot:Tbor_TRINITY_DN3839_c0_g1::TRINITY_DN3839_c0_g1_i1::g.5677::m.5677